MVPTSAEVCSNPMAIADATPLSPRCEVQLFSSPLLSRHFPPPPFHTHQSQRFRSFVNRSSRHSYSGKLRQERVVRFRNFRRLDVRRNVIEVEDVWVRDGKIIDPERRFWEAAKGNEFYADKVIDGRGFILAPGFIDIQLNGAFGIDFTSPTLTSDEVATVSRGILAHGCTSYLPTIITSASDVYARNLKLLRVAKPMAAAADGGAPREEEEEEEEVEYAEEEQQNMMAAVLGVHLEGPFIRIKGAHNELFLRDFDSGVATLREVYGSEEQCVEVRLVTLAPEIPNALEVVSHLAERGVVVSLGHSNACVEEAEAAVAAGATLVTHMFNAMTSFHHRDPGIIGLLGGRYGSGYARRDDARRAPSGSDGRGRAGSISSQPQGAAFLERGTKRLRSSPSAAHRAAAAGGAVPSRCALEATRVSSRARIFYSIIADGIHCHPYSLAVAHKTHPAGLVLITDAMCAMGLGLGRHKLGSMSVDVVATVKKKTAAAAEGGDSASADGQAASASASASAPASASAAAVGPAEAPHPHDWMESCRAVISGTETLAGSVVSMDTCVRLMRRFTGCSTVDALIAATLHPAQVLGIDDRKGTLDVGADADFVILDDSLHVVATFCGGDLAWSDPEQFQL